MKNNRVGMRIIILLYVASTLLFAGESFAAAEKSKISISVKDRSDKDDDKREDEVETASSLTVTSFETETEIVTLTAQIKNSGKQPVTGQLAWCFISDHSSGKNKFEVPEKPVPALFSPGKKEVTIEPDSVLKEVIVSELFMYEEKTVDRESYTGSGGSSSRDYETGDVYKGYLILLTVDGEIIAMNSNSSRYKKDEWIAKCRNP